MEPRKEKNEGRSLAERLLEYGKSDACPLHMPGHKRNSPFPWMEPLAAMDITEIHGFDNLHGAEGILREAMERMARVWGSRRSFFLVNGSTCGILAGMASLSRPGDTILMARNCHRAVYHGVELNRLRPVYLWPGTDPETGIGESIRPEQVEQAVGEHPEIRLAVITSPTYEGILSDVAAIREILHRQGIPLLVDEAHGAHLGFSPGFPSGAVRAGADLVVQSLHKTLPSLTQTAAVHVCGELADPRELERQLSIFETSSPSYLLMASLDSCVRFLEQEGLERFAAYEKRLKRLERRTAGLGSLRVLGSLAAEPPGSHPGFWAKDPGKLVLLPRGGRPGGLPAGGLSAGGLAAGGRRALGGVWLSEQLRSRFGIELEMALDRYALAMTSLCDTEENLDRLAAALEQLDRELDGRQEGEPGQSPAGTGLQAAGEGLPGEERPRRLLYSWEAWERPRKAVPRQEAAGRAAAEYVWAYPPGIPLAAPGEQVTEGLLERWRQMEAAGVELASTSGRWKAGEMEVL